jgi:membrane protein insertase Oxa1/YidC/SpoIIIJ
MPSELTRDHYILLLVLTFILFPIVLIALPFLPDTVPLHFTIDLSNETTTYNMGSKYMLLLLPLPVVATGVLTIGLTWYLNKRGKEKGKGSRSGMMMFYIAIAIKLALIALLLWLLSLSF